MAVALLKKLDLKMWKGPRPIQVKKKKKKVGLCGLKKNNSTHPGNILIIQFDTGVSYEVDLCTE